MVMRVGLDGKTLFFRLEAHMTWLYDGGHGLMKCALPSVERVKKFISSTLDKGSVELMNKLKMYF